MFERTIHVQKTSAVTGLGIFEAFQWIHDQIIGTNNKRKTSHHPPSIIAKPMY
jgi:hypothetical protein